MASFRRAVADGVAYLELDVHASRDGVVTVIHDPTVDRTTEGTGEVRTLAFDELRRLDAGHRFEAAGGTHPWRGRGVRLASLEEVVRGLPDVALNIEIKQQGPPIEHEVVSVIERCGAAERVLLAAEHHAIMERIREITALPTSASAEEAREFFERCFEERLGGWQPPFRALQIPPRFEEYELVTETTLAAAHALGVEMHVWTINDAAEMRRLLALGVDGVMSDFPAVLVEAARSRGGPILDS